MNSKKARKLRRLANIAASVPYSRDKINIDVKSVESGGLIRRGDQYVPKIVPKTTWQEVVVSDCTRGLYKKLKKNGGIPNAT